MRLTLVCLILLVFNFIGSANAMIYERVIKVSNDQAIRTWSTKEPKCTEFINDCTTVLNESIEECNAKAEKAKLSLKCF